MTTQQLRAQIAALQDATIDENRNFRSAYDEGKFDALSAVDALLDSMQEEPQVKKLAGLQHVNETCKENGNSLTQEPVNDDLEEAASSFARKDSEGISNPANFYYTVADKARIFKAGAEWQREKDESTTEDLGEYINELSKQFPEVSFAKLSRIAVRVAKWQKEQMMAKAIEAHVNYAWSSLCFGGFDWSKTGLGIGDKCKLIIIKEEEYEMGI